MESKEEAAKADISSPPAGGKRGRGDPPANWVSIFGFVIVTKADLLAASAFLLSLMTLLYQASIWIQGPRPRIYTPDTVYIFFDQYANNRTVTRFAGQLSFLNNAPPNHDAIVERVDLVATTAGGTIREPWLNVATVRRDDKQLHVDGKEPTHPFIIRSGSATSDLYSFAPQERDCVAGATCRPEGDFVSDIDFLKALTRGDTLQLTFEVRYAGRDDVQRVGCTVAVSPGLTTYLAENGWFAARCKP